MKSALENDPFNAMSTEPAIDNQNNDDSANPELESTKPEQVPTSQEPEPPKQEENPPSQEQVPTSQEQDLTSQEPVPTSQEQAPTSQEQAPTDLVSQEPESPAIPDGASETDSSPRAVAAIGSQRDTADKSLSPAKPQAVQSAVANPIDLSGKPPGPVPPPVPPPTIHSTAGLSDDIDSEIEAELGGLSMDQVVDSSETGDDEIEPNTRLTGTVAKIHNDHVFFKLKNQSEGVAPLHQFKETPTEGDSVEVIVRVRNKEDGLYELSLPGAAVGVTDWDDIVEGAVVEARVTGSNTGGLEVMVNSIAGFIPASQISRVRVEDFSEYADEKFPCVVMEVNPDKRKLVLSRRAVLDRENEEKRKELVKELEVGQIREGVVTRLMDFGAFCDLGGNEGLIHVSKLSWSRVKHPSDVVAVGEGVKVKIEKLDLEANRISLSLRDTLDNPWNSVATDFNVNDIVKGTVTRIADFGAFVKIAPGVEGLVHISELAYQRIAKVNSVVEEGQEIEVKIKSIDTDSQKIALSHKACLAPPTPRASGKPGDKPAESDAEEPARELAVPNRNQPLKGGKDRDSGGESVGLNW